MSLMRLQIVIQVRYQGAFKAPKLGLEEDYKLWQNAATV